MNLMIDNLELGLGLSVVDFDNIGVRRIGEGDVALKTTGCQHRREMNVESQALEVFDPKGSKPSGTAWFPIQR